MTSPIGPLPKKKKSLTERANTALNHIRITPEQGRAAGALGQVGTAGGSLSGALIGTGIGVAVKHPAQGAGLGGAIGGALGGGSGAAAGLYGARPKKVKKAPAPVSKSMTEAPGAHKPRVDPDTQRKVATGLMGFSALANGVALKAAYKETKGAVRPTLDGLNRAQRARKIAGHVGAKAALPIAATDVAAGVLATKVMNDKPKPVAKSAEMGFPVDFDSARRAIAQAKKAKDVTTVLKKNQESAMDEITKLAPETKRGMRNGALAGAAGGLLSVGVLRGAAIGTGVGAAVGAHQASQHEAAMAAKKVRKPRKAPVAKSAAVDVDALFAIAKAGKPVSGQVFHAPTGEGMVGPKVKLKLPKGKIAAGTAVLGGGAGLLAHERNRELAKAYSETKHRRASDGKFTGGGGSKSNGYRDYAVTAGIGAGMVGAAEGGARRALANIPKHRERADLADRVSQQSGPQHPWMTPELRAKARKIAATSRVKADMGKDTARALRAGGGVYGGALLGVGAVGAGFHAKEQHDKKKKSVSKSLTQEITMAAPDVDELFSKAREMAYTGTIEKFEPETKRAAKTGAKWGAGIEGSLGAAGGAVMGGMTHGPKGALLGAAGMGAAHAVGGAATYGAVGAGVGALKASARKDRDAIAARRRARAPRA